MTDDELERLVHAAISPVEANGPTSDGWPALVARLDARREWHWIDLGLAAAVLASLVLFPEWVTLLAYHL
jgi:hypothetical protein